MCSRLSSVRPSSVIVATSHEPAGSATTSRFPQPLTKTVLSSRVSSSYSKPARASRTRAWESTAIHSPDTSASGLSGSSISFSRSFEAPVFPRLVVGGAGDDFGLERRQAELLPRELFRLFWLVPGFRLEGRDQLGAAQVQLAEVGAVRRAGDRTAASTGRPFGELFVGSLLDVLGAGVQFRRAERRLALFLSSLASAGVGREHGFLEQLVDEVDIGQFRCWCSRS